MAEPIGRGDFVECLIDADFGFRRGKIYCVSEIGPITGCQACGERRHAGYRFVGGPEPRTYWAGCRFRPVYRRKADAFDHLLAPTPLRETEDA